MRVYNNIYFIRLWFYNVILTIRSYPFLACPLETQRLFHFFHHFYFFFFSESFSFSRGYCCFSEINKKSNRTINWFCQSSEKNGVVAQMAMGRHRKRNLCWLEQLRSDEISLCQFFLFC